MFQIVEIVISICVLYVAYIAVINIIAVNNYSDVDTLHRVCVMLTAKPQSLTHFVPERESAISLSMTRLIAYIIYSTCNNQGTPTSKRNREHYYYDDESDVQE